MFSRGGNSLGEFSPHKNVSKHVVRVEVRGRRWLPPSNMKRVDFDEIVKEGWDGDMPTMPLAVLETQQKPKEKGKAPC